MKICQVHAVYFSPTGTTRTVVTCITQTIAALLSGVEETVLDFTLPVRRQEGVVSFHPSELVVVGLPVYAGRLPNLLLRYLSSFSGGGAWAVPVVLFGNRSYGNALTELRDILEKSGFHTIGAAAFVGQHSFSEKLAQGRPDADDLVFARKFANGIVEKVNLLLPEDKLSPIEVPGKGAPDYGGYYKPLNDMGEVVNMLKVKPVTTDACIRCRRCASVCPLGSIDPQDVAQVSGICIKCNACVKICPVQAKKWLDESYLGHLRFLEQNYISRMSAEFFL